MSRIKTACLECKGNLPENQMRRQFLRNPSRSRKLPACLYSAPTTRGATGGDPFSSNRCPSRRSPGSHPSTPSYMRLCAYFLAAAKCRREVFARRFCGPGSHLRRPVCLIRHDHSLTRQHLKIAVNPDTRSRYAEFKVNSILCAQRPFWRILAHRGVALSTEDGSTRHVLAQKSSVLG